MPPGVKSYYQGGCRVLIDGVPTRLARRPTKHTLALMREKPDYAGNGQHMRHYLRDYRAYRRNLKNPTGSGC